MAGRTVASHLANLGTPCDRLCRRPSLLGRLPASPARPARGARRGAGSRINPSRPGYCGSYEAEAGARFAQRLLERKLEVTAIVFGNDALAIGFMRVAQQRGIRMPQDLSIVGFDNIAGGAMVWPGLTTVAQPMRDMGRDACRYLFEPAPPRRPPTVEYPMELIMRESTGPPRRALKSRAEC